MNGFMNNSAKPDNNPFYNGSSLENQNRRGMILKNPQYPGGGGMNNMGMQYQSAPAINRENN